MIFSLGHGEKGVDRLTTAGRVTNNEGSVPRGPSARSQFLFDTNERPNRTHFFVTHSKQTLVPISIQYKFTSIRYKMALLANSPGASSHSSLATRHCSFNRQPRRLEITVTHTKQSISPRCNRLLSGTFRHSERTRSILLCDLIFDFRNFHA